MRVITLVAPAWLVIPSTAMAGTVSVRARPLAPGFGTVRYEAAPDEANRVTLTEAGTAVHVTDAGAAVRAIAPCRSIDIHTAVCGEPGAMGHGNVRVNGADGDDVIAANGLRVAAYGGPGDDVITGDGRLDGGGGHDRLLGGEQSDTLIDGDVPGAVDADMLDGGNNLDTLDYRARVAPLRIDTADGAPDGERGEGDVLRSIERVLGGSGADDIRGGPGIDIFAGGDGADRLDGRGRFDLLEGNAGDDWLVGGPGRDWLEGGTGFDRMSGGRGSDNLMVRREGADAAACGSGIDTLIGPNRRDLIGPDCEQGEFSLRREGYVIHTWLGLHPQRRDDGSATFELGCPLGSDGAPLAISGSVALRSATGRHRQLGRGDVPSRQGKRCGDYGLHVLVRVVLTQAGRGLLARPGRAHLLVSLRGHFVPHARWIISLR